jgi:hypothetical protein
VLGVFVYHNRSTTRSNPEYTFLANNC